MSLPGKFAENKLGVLLIGQFFVVKFFDIFLDLIRPADLQVVFPADGDHLLDPQGLLGDLTNNVIPPLGEIDIQSHDRRQIGDFPNQTLFHEQVKTGYNRRTDQIDRLRIALGIVAT